MEYDNKLPIYQQIIDMILLSIAKGSLAAGSKIAPVREIAAIFKVNPNTMQRSLAKLEEMGYLFSERTSGRYVTNDLGLIASLKARLPAQITQKYIDEMLDYGMKQGEIADYVRNYISTHRTECDAAGAGVQRDSFPRNEGAWGQSPHLDGGINSGQSAGN